MRAIRCADCGRRCLSDTDRCFLCDAGIEPGEPRCPGCGDLVAAAGEWCCVCWADEMDARDGDRRLDAQREAEV